MGGEYFLDVRLPSMASIDERGTRVVPCNPSSGGESMRLAGQDYVERCAGHVASDGSQHGARRLQGVVEIPVANPAAELVRPNLDYVVAPTTQRLDGLDIGACSP